jgi:hypothetical protein
LNLIDLHEFFADYSLSSVVIACIVCAITFFTDKLKRNKAVKTISSFVPFVLGIVLTCFNNLIFDGKIEFSASTLSAGFMSGWLSVMIKVIIKRVISGQKPLNMDSTAVIIGLIEGYVKSECLEAVADFIKEVIFSCQKDSGSAIEGIAKKLTETAQDQFADTDLKSLAGLIFASVKQIKE